MALTNLTFGDGTNKALLCSMKSSMLALVSQLFNTNEELCQVAASVLRNLSWKADLASKKTLREVGAVTSLMKASMRVQKETTLKSILSALWNLSAHCSENKADICTVIKALEFLISTLNYKSPSKTTAIIENGGGILRNVSSHIAVREDYRQVLRQNGCLQILLKHLRSPSLTIVSNACGTLWNLSARCAEDQQALWDMGAVGMLRNLVHSKHKMISMGSSAALKNLLAARPGMVKVEMNKHNMNRPSLHVRKQRALESEIDQNLSETCENVESPRDSPVETKKQESAQFVYPVYPLPEGDPRLSILRGQLIPRSQSGENTLYTEAAESGVARSGSQDSVGSTHSDISHDRSRHASGGNKAQRSQSQMGGSLDRNKEGHIINQRFLEGRSERNPLGNQNSRILQVMQEVALHAGLGNQADDSAKFKAPYPVTSQKSQIHSLPQSSTASCLYKQQIPHPMSHPQHISYPPHMYKGPHGAPYGRFVMAEIPSSNMPPHFNLPSHRGQTDDSDTDEKPLDYSMKYQEGRQPQQTHQSHSEPKFGCNIPRQPLVGNFVGKSPSVPANLMNNFTRSNNNFVPQSGVPPPIHYNSAYAETDLDDQPTDYSARYGVEYMTDQYRGARGNYDGQYEESDPNCADCKLEEARRLHDRLGDQDEDQIKMFCTEDTPYLSTATSMTDLSTAVKILEEAEEHCPAEEDAYNDDATQNFGSKYGENEVNGVVQRGSDSGGRGDDQRAQQRFDGEISSRSGSNMTDIQTGTTVITNYHLNTERHDPDQSSNHNKDEPEERSFHDNRNDDAPMDQMKMYCEEGTPVCFSRVSSLSSLHSSEANDRNEKRPPGTIPQGPLQSIEESDDMNSSMSKMQPNTMQQQQHNSYRPKQDHHSLDSSEKEHKTVTFDHKEQIQETPMMFSRSTSLGSLSSFDTQSVHSSVFSEYSRRASEVVSPSELPDSPSETMPPSPRRTKSPERNGAMDRNSSKVVTQLFPDNQQPQQFSARVDGNVPRVNPLQQFMGITDMVKQLDYETGSCKSEAPVVYADEGTPPVFNDNLSELSCVTGSDNYNINDKTLVAMENMTPGGKSQASSVSRGVMDKGMVNTAEPRQNIQNDMSERMNQTPRNQQQHQQQYQQQKQHPNQNQHGNQRQNQHQQLNHQQSQNQHLNQQQNQQQRMSEDSRIVSEDMHEGSNQLNPNINMKDDEKMSSNSDVSEGEDDLLASFISSAMPISTKKPRKSTSEVNSRRKSTSSKPDSGSSSRSKTPAKSQPHSGSSSKSSSVNSSAKKSIKSDTKSNNTSPNGKPAGQAPDIMGDSPSKHRSQIPRPLAPRQVQKLAQLDSSMDSGRSYVEEDSPFNTSNTQSIVPSRPNANPKAVVASPMILQKARNLSHIEAEADDGDENCKTYATEDTPFSGSIPTSPQLQRRHIEVSQDPEQDTVKSYATEDTPFSGSVPGSPPPTHPSNFIVDDTEEDIVKSFNTEDTPFSGSAIGSPKLAKKQMNPSCVNQPQPTCQAIGSFNTQPNSQAPVAKPNQPSHPTIPQGYPALQESLSNGQAQFNPQMLSNLAFLGNDYEEDCGDMIKTFATEGTPLNFSRTGSCSDLSSLNANFDEKVKLENVPRPPAPPVEATPVVASHQEDDSDSSSVGENDKLLEEIIQSAMPVPRANKPRKSFDRNPEGAESVDQPKKPVMVNNQMGNKQFSQSYQTKPSNLPPHFQPQRTSSLAHPSSMQSKPSQPSTVQGSDSYMIGAGDQMKTYAVEGTPSNMSNATSLSDLTTDSYGQRESVNVTNRGPRTNAQLSTGSGFMSSFETMGMGNNSVFMQTDGVGDSLNVFKMEGTPQSFSCNDSLSSLGFAESECSNEITRQVKAIANTLTNKLDNKVCANATGKAIDLRNNTYNTGNGPNKTDEHMKLGKNVGMEQNSINSGMAKLSVGGIERQVIGQSSEDQSVHEEDVRGVKSNLEETKKYQVEGTPLCFSISSSLSSINDPDIDKKNENKPDARKKQVATQSHKMAAVDEQKYHQVEHTPICFSRNSSLSSLSVNSDEDEDDALEMALLEDCISSALPSRRKPENDGVADNNTYKAGSRYSGMSMSDGEDGGHNSRLTNWRQQPHRSSDDVFRKPTADAKGRPCRRSRSEDSEKHYKDLSNQQMMQQMGQQVASSHRGSFDSLNNQRQQQQQQIPVIPKAQELDLKQQQIISESKNLANQMMKMTMSVEKEGSDKNESPESDYNFFMSCSGNTEISVEGISKQSFPSSMAAPDTDDDMLDSSVLSIRNEADGQYMQYSGDNTLTEFGDHRLQSNNHNQYQHLQVDNRVGGNGKGGGIMESSLTSEDGRLLAENANLVMTEMRMNQMVLSGTSTVDEDRFIENETLSLVSNDYTSDTASEASEWSENSSNRKEHAAPGRPRIVKPSDKPAQVVKEPENTKGVRGKRKPLYSNKSASANTSAKSESRTPTRPGSGNVSKVSPRSVTGSSSANSSSSSANTSRKSHTLRTMPQASSTPVKNSPARGRQTGASPQPRSSSLEQRSQSRTSNTSTTSANRSTSSNRSGSATRGGVVNQNMSNQSRTSAGKTSPKSKENTKENQSRPKGLSKQGTFIKESTNKNAPVISPNDKTKDIGAAYGVKLRQKKLSDSSQVNRNSSGSSRSNYSNMSNNSNSFSTTSSDSPPDSWSKALTSYNFMREHEASTQKKKGKNGNVSAGSTARRNLIKDGLLSKIPSPTQAGKKGAGNQIIKSSSGTSLTRGMGGLNKTGSSGSIKQSGSRPTTPVIMNNRKESTGSISSSNDGKKNNGKKTVTSKIAGLWKSEKADKTKNKNDKKTASKLPVAKSKSKKADNVEKSIKKDEVPKSTVNRNTYILTESIDGLSKSSTYDKLNSTNDETDVPSCDDSGKPISKSGSVISGLSNGRVTKSVFDDNEMNKTCRDISAYEVGVEYDLEEAWASKVEKSIEVMSRSIELNKNKIDSFYDEFVDTSKMDLTNSPANRLSKSGSMTEIELEFGRIHSGTWTKKKSHNEFTVLPNADETSRTLPLKKRSESLNFSTHMSVSQVDFDNNGEEVWLRRDDKLRASDITMSKKKRSFKGSSGFLNAVSKMFGGSKRGSEKQSKSFAALEKESKRLNETIQKQLKKEREKELKLNKSQMKENKMNKSEIKVETRMDGKVGKNESKVVKKDSKLKGLEGETLGSMSSLKKSAEDLIDIDKSDDDDVFSVQNYTLPLTGTQSLRKSENTETSQSFMGSDRRHHSVGNSNAVSSQSFTNVPLTQINHQNQQNQSTCAINSNSSSPVRSDSDLSYHGDESPRSVQSSPSPHLTKTEMLLARRQAQLNSSNERSDDDVDSEGKRKPIVTTV